MMTAPATAHHLAGLLGILIQKVLLELNFRMKQVKLKVKQLELIMGMRLVEQILRMKQVNRTAQVKRVELLIMKGATSLSPHC